MDREQEFRRHFDVTNFHDTAVVETKDDGDTCEGIVHHFSTTKNFTN